MNQGSEVRHCLPHNVKIHCGTHPAFCSVGTGTLSREVNRPGLEDSHSPPQVSKLRTRGTTPPLHHLPSCCGACLSKRTKFTVFSLPLLPTLPAMSGCQLLKLGHEESSFCQRDFPRIHSAFKISWTNFWTFPHLTYLLTPCSRVLLEKLPVLS